MLMHIHLYLFDLFMIRQNEFLNLNHLVCVLSERKYWVYEQLLWWVWVSNSAGERCVWELYALQWHHNECHGVSNRRRLDCLPNRLFSGRSKKTSKLRATDLFKGNPTWQRKIFPFDGVIMETVQIHSFISHHHYSIFQQLSRIDSIRQRVHIFAA